MLKPKIVETDHYVTPDGVEYLLTSPNSRIVFSWEGEGMPPIDYITQRGPFQHGETVLNYFLRPRILQCAIRHEFCTREEYWTGRNALLSILRPNRQTTSTLTPGRIRKRLANAERRDIDVFIIEGPGYAARQSGQWDERAFTEVLRFIAHNPIWYDPVQRSQTFNTASITDLVFPITFPIVFTSLDISANLTYLGTWIEYPVITINGPISNFVLENTTTDEEIALTAVLLTGESIVIDLRYGIKTVIKSDGSNLIGTLTSDSDLATWHLAPDPEATNGINAIHITAQGANATTSIIINYYRRYIGV